MDKKLSTGALKLDRCMALYGYLLARGDKWVQMEDAAIALSSYYLDPRMLTEDGPEFHDTNGRLLLTNDIRIIPTDNRDLHLFDDFFFGFFALL